MVKADKRIKKNIKNKAKTCDKYNLKECFIRLERFDIKTLQSGIIKSNVKSSLKNNSKSSIESTDDVPQMVYSATVRVKRTDLKGKSLSINLNESDFHEVKRSAKVRAVKAICSAEKVSTTVPVAKTNTLSMSSSSNAIVGQNGYMLRSQSKPVEHVKDFSSPAGARSMKRKRKRSVSDMSSIKPVTSTNTVPMSSNATCEQNEYAMSLRSRPKQMEQTAPIVTAKKLVIAKQGATTQHAFKTWEKLAAKSKSGDEGYVAEINVIVLAKMRSYRPWPAIVLNDNGRTVFWVRFFGKGSHGSVKKVDCVPFDKTTECVVQFLQAAKNGPCDDYRRAVREAEIALSIPAEKSLLNIC